MKQKNQADANKYFYINMNDEDTIDINRYLLLFLNNWYWFAAALFISISIAYGINRWSEEVYTVSSTLLIKDDPNVALTEIFPGSEGFRNQQKINNEIGILKSYNLNYRVMQDLPEFHIIYTSVGKRGIAASRMYKTSPFVVVYDSLKNQKKGLKVKIKLISASRYELEIDDKQKIKQELAFGEKFVSDEFDFKLQLRDSLNFVFDPQKSNNYYFVFADPAILANQYRSKLTIVPVESEATLMALTIKGFVPEQEADYLNKLMDIYLDFGLEYKNETAAKTLEFIETQLGTISDSLKLAEDDLENFRLINKIINISKEGTLIQDKLEQIDTEISRLTIQKNYYEYLKDYLLKRKDNEEVIAPSVIGITDQLLIRLVDDFTRLQKEKRQLNTVLFESSEPLRLIDSNIETTRKALTENINDGLQNIEGLINDSNDKLSEIQMEVKKLPTTERQMINIQRRFDINNTVYTFLLEKRAEAGIAKASNVSDNRIIDRAGMFSSSRIKPKEKTNLMIAGFLGLIIPLVSIFILDLINNRIIDKKDIEKNTTIPVLGYILHNNLDVDLPVKENPGSMLSESFRSVRTNLKHILKDVEHPVISVSSTITAEGKTFISANLGTIMAMLGKKVLLIGLDLRKPKINRIFGMNSTTGMSNYLTGKAEFDDIVMKTDIENLWHSPSGPIPPNPAELIESDRMKKFIQKAKERFDFIIVDTPPFAIVTDALLVSEFTDYYLFVVRQRYSTKNSMTLIEDLHNRDCLKDIGIIINDIKIAGYYGYGLRYGSGMTYNYKNGYNYYQYGNGVQSKSVQDYYKEDI